MHIFIAELTLANKITFFTIKANKITIKDKRDREKKYIFTIKILFTSDFGHDLVK